jgi:hypothetical protein
MTKDEFSLIIKKRNTDPFLIVRTLSFGRHDSDQFSANFVDIPAKSGRRYTAKG